MNQVIKQENKSYDWGNIGDIVWYGDKLGNIVSNYNNPTELKFLPLGYGSYYAEDLETINHKLIVIPTFEDKIKFIEKDFCWGKVIKTHYIGQFQFIEAERNNKDYPVLFSAYINFESISRSYMSLESAMIGVIAYKYDGSSSQAAEFFEKMIGLK